MTREDRILNYVIEYKSKNNGNSPSYAQIMKACRISSKSEVKRILEIMASSGLLKRNGYRSIEIPNSEWRQNDN